MRNRRLGVVLSSIVAAISVTAGLIAFTGSAAAATVVRVVNASEGVYWRASTDWNSAIRQDGFGAYTGDTLNLICFTRGGVVPPYNNNPLWYRASIASGRGQGSGLINDHFLQTSSANPDVPEAGVPPCDSPQPSGPGRLLSPGASIYYSPFDGDWVTKHHLPLYVTSVTDETLFKSKWRNGCDASHVADFPNVINGKTVSTLTGWSEGRLGPLLYLKAHPEKWNQINYVLLYDPGNLAQLTGDCPGINFSTVLHDWLTKNPTAHLAILAGYVTADTDHANGQYAHQGLQQAYFPQLRGPDISPRVTVCNYDGMNHTDVWTKFQSSANQAPIQSACPKDGDKAADALWHP